MKIDFSSSLFRLFMYPLLGGEKKSLARFIDPRSRSAKISIFCLCMKNKSTFLSLYRWGQSNVNFHIPRTMRDWISTPTQIISFNAKLISHPKINNSSFSSSSLLSFDYLHTRNILSNCVGRQDVSKNRFWFLLFIYWTAWRGNVRCDGSCGVSVFILVICYFSIFFWKFPRGN